MLFGFEGFGIIWAPTSCSTRAPSCSRVRHRHAAHSGPTLVGSDSSSHEQVVNRMASSNRSKPFLKSYVIQMQRVQAELIAIHKISDANMPSDFLTKWISGRKLRRSIRYATNSDEFVPRDAVVPP